MLILKFFQKRGKNSCSDNSLFGETQTWLVLRVSVKRLGKTSARRVKANLDTHRIVELPKVSGNVQNGSCEDV